MLADQELSKKYDDEKDNQIPNDVTDKKDQTDPPEAPDSSLEDKEDQKAAFYPETKEHYSKRVQKRIDELIYTINDKENQIKQTENRLVALERKLAEDSYKNQLNFLTQQRAAAYEENDSKKLAEIDGKMYELAFQSNNSQNQQTQPQISPPNQNAVYTQGVASPSNHYYPQQAPPQAQADINSYIKDITVRFAEKNPWYEENLAMKATADEISQKVFNNPFWSGRSLDEQFDEIARRTKSYFSNAPKPASGVEGSSGYFEGSPPNKLAKKFDPQEVEFTKKLQGFRSTEEALTFLGR